MAAILTVTMLTVTASIAKVATYERALGYVPSAYQSALATFKQSFSTGSYAPPASTAPVCLSNDSPCTFYGTAAITLPPQSAPQATSDCGATANCAANLQVHPVVAESRISARVTIAILDGNRQPLVTRARFISARTFSVAPYVAVTGERDGAVTDRTTASEGDNAGAPATQIIVKYHDTTGTTADIEKDRWSTQGWTNGNTTPSTWSP